MQVHEAMTINKLLIANRGEIAVRIIKACRDLGIGTVALYTDADRSWAARALADEAVHIGAGPATDSYINFDKVIDAAKHTGADAIHPGYGFLAENAEFARRCEVEGIIFIGPSADVIDLMGNKAKAKEVVTGLGVPVIPGRDGFGISDEALEGAALKVGYPLMIKAVAGGGGMGMRIVAQGADFVDALASVRREAKASFGDDRVLIERYFPSVRHIEVQVLADAFGNAVHLFERECSIQRRRQKIIEEAPSPFVSEGLRERLCAASLKIVEAVGYRGVGTVEFVVVDDETENQEAGEFYFLEMNTRLQVEHGVTEEATGVDLVRAQIEVAEGRLLAIRQSDIALRAHAIECRLCAESPAKAFQPMTGRVADWRPATSIQGRAGLRTDTGLLSGTEISAYYDSLIAKLIAVGATRAEALRRMQAGLGHTAVLGLETNQRFLKTILEDKIFQAGGANTTYIERSERALLTPLSDMLRSEIALVCAVATALRETGSLGPGQGGPFQRTYDFIVEDQDLIVHLSCLPRFEGPPRYDAEIDGVDHVLTAELGADWEEAGGLALSIDGIERRYRISTAGARLFLYVPGEGSFVVSRALSLSEESQGNGAHGYTATMTGLVAAILTAPGAAIEPGDKLMVIESMKMEHAIIAQSPGLIKEVCVEEGVTVQAGATLLTLMPPGDAPNEAPYERPAQGDEEQGAEVPQ